MHASPVKHYLRRLLAAASLSFLIGAGLLIWTAYKDRASGASLGNLARVSSAGVLVALAGYGSRLRHQSPPASVRDASSPGPSEGA